MKKIFFIAALAAFSLASNAQETLNFSTYKATDLKPYAGHALDITTNRVLFNGWNTLSLPYSMTESQLDEAFGSDCRLEMLVGAEKVNGEIRLNFQDVKSEGLQANTPYILYYGGNTGVCKIRVNAVVREQASTRSFTVEGSGETVTMCGASEQTAPNGLYGIMAVNNSEAQFVSVDGKPSLFFPTRCYVKLSNGTSETLLTNHIEAGDVTGISNVLSGNETADVYNLSGSRIASGLNASAVSHLNKGVYVINGKKVLVK